MACAVAPGLPGDWLNGWLAAIGITVLVSEARLSWSGTAIPVAQFDHDGDLSLARMVAENLPPKRSLDSLAISSLKRNVSLSAFRENAGKARGAGDHSLASSVSDLVVRNDDNLPHGAFDPGAPRGETLHSRLIRCREAIPDPCPDERVALTLEGTGSRVKTNGLGFDVRRLPSGMQPDAGNWVDPLVECLCFVALSLFPTRGNGGREVRQRGWTDRASRRGAFRWPVWSQPLGTWGIDALLDRLHADPSFKATRRLGITGIFQSVPYEARDKSDPTRGYGAERVGRT